MRSAALKNRDTPKAIVEKWQAGRIVDCTSLTALVSLAYARVQPSPTISLSTSRVCKAVNFASVYPPPHTLLSKPWYFTPGKKH